jgi:predicted alpha/beta-fold hydrolase
LILSAADDPFVPPEQFDTPAIARNPSIRRVVTAHGGHCGFVARNVNGHDGYWAEAFAIAFLADALGRTSAERIGF